MLVLLILMTLAAIIGVFVGVKDVARDSKLKLSPRFYDFLWFVARVFVVSIACLVVLSFAKGWIHVKLEHSNERGFKIINEMTRY